ncbi:monovalent cation/H+ antiporter subunit D family protein [Modestobacter sp. SYSU DS0875]
MSALLAAPVLGPLLAAGLLLLLGRRRPGPSPVDRAVGLAVAAAVVVVAAVLLVGALDGDVPVLRVAGWPSVIAITFAADALSALVLLLTSVVVLLGLVYAIGTGEDDAPLTVPLVLVMSAGVSGVLLTADLFNLFVFVEVMLVPSYVLVALGRDRQRVAGSRLYVTVNLFASTVFLAGTGLLYGVAGTVQLGELAGVAAAGTPAALAAGVAMLAMAVKSAVVPFHSWVPGSYAVTGPAVTVLFSGLLTKVGLYVLFRLYAVLFDRDPDLRWLLLTAAVVTMVVGVLAAVGESSVRRVLISHMVSQIGYVVVGLGLATLAGFTAALFFLVQYVLVKAALFMVGGALRTRYGTDSLHDLGGLVHRERLLAVAFGGSALALVGIPPTSGFVGKLQLATATAAEGAWWVLAALLAVSLITLVSMLKVWNGVFWAPAEDGPPERVDGPERAGDGPGSTATRTRPGRGARAALVGPPLLLAAGALVLGIWAEPLLQAAEAAAAGLVDPGGWVAAVTGR